MEAIKVLAKILTNILTALYEPFGFSLLLSFLAMFFYLYAYEPQDAGKGWKSGVVTWYQKFKESVFFRKLFFLVFVTSLVLFRTLCKSQYKNAGFGQNKNVGFPTFLFCLFNHHQSLAEADLLICRKDH